MISTISGGPTFAGTSNRLVKQYVRVAHYPQVFGIKFNWHHKVSKVVLEPITFYEEEEEGILYPHDDPMIIRAEIANYDVRRVLIDTGSSVNVIFADTFRRMGIADSQRGIEANPEKIKAIIDMERPKTQKDIQSLAGRVAALTRFISKATDKCVSFFKALKEGKEHIAWIAECDQAFQDLKNYMSIAPLLSKPLPGEVLFLHLSVSSTVVSSVPIRKQKKAELPIFYVSKALQNAEIWYPPLEQLELAIIISTRRLRPYCQAHEITVLTNQPLRQVLQKLEASGRLIKWVIELREFDIQFKPRPVEKGQAVADFISEHIPSIALEPAISEANDGKPDFAARDTSMTAYLSTTYPLLQEFQAYEIRQILRTKNSHADALARLALAINNKDTNTLVKKCDKCQRFGNIPHIPVEPLTQIVSPWPFAQWGLDLIDPMSQGKGQVKYVVVAVDYFTKWVDVEALATITAARMEDFVWTHICYRFGIPYAKIPDNGRQFDSELFRQFCTRLKVNLFFASPAHP
ncbi:uncharacterized protein LOC117613900 [Prunus dulcis]|uniref:uncharacterized protein LOC117613900 n=1 Tax=Prunus dulcis TaxID=3755 RepID=UPI001482BEEA|nr:uncharacterized protein LOC117613900 [Prunus dulcis]